jgi:hypothetical protein
MMATTDGGGEEDDLGVLIYRESQLRKAEAEAIAAESKKTLSCASPRRTTSTRKKRTVVKRESIVAKAKVKDTLTKRKRQSSTEKELTQKKYDWRKYQKKCSTDGCTILLSRGERAEARCKDQTMCYGRLVTLSI